MALAEADGELQLTGEANHSGTFSLRHQDAADVVFRVKVRRGDEALASLPMSPRILLKIDVEGFEMHVIRGMSEFIRSRQPLCSVEVTPAWLEQAGYSAVLLFQEMESAGYRAFSIMRDAGFWRQTIRLEPVTRIVAEQRDVLFVPESRVAEVLRAFGPGHAHPLPNGHGSVTAPHSRVRAE